jgi:arylsulfatase A-like enzyme
MPNSSFIAFCLVVFVGCSNPSLKSDSLVAESRPNIVVIFADDIGVETIGAYGGQYLTPRIDSLSENGVRFDSGHATPVCTTSRTRLMTGTYNFKHYKAFAHLDPQAYTFSKFLKDSGYQTVVAGKWQLAGNHFDGLRGSYPQDVGFDEHIVWQLEWNLKGKRYWQPTLTVNDVARTYCKDGFGPTILNNYVLDYIDRKKEEPFFIYYTPILAHDPWTTTPDSLHATTKEEKFSGMMEYLDKMVGRVLDKLDEHRLTENTLIYFIGDNGTHPQITSLRNGQPVTGGKWYTRDSGTHVPFIMQWKGSLPAGEIRSGLVDVMDVFPTLVAAVGSNHVAPKKLMKLDGLNLLPYAKNPDLDPRDWIFMHYDPQWGSDWFQTPMPSARFVFNQDFKLYGDGRFIDMHQDPLEEHPLDVAALKESVQESHQMLLNVMNSMGDGPLAKPFMNPKAAGVTVPPPHPDCGESESL